MKLRISRLVVLATVAIALWFSELKSQDPESERLHELIEREHGIHFVPIDRGVFPQIEIDVDETKRIFKTTSRRIARSLAEESGIRALYPTIESFYLGSTEISHRQLQSVYRAALSERIEYTYRISSFAPAQLGRPDEPAKGFSFIQAIVFCNELSVLYNIPEYYRITLTLKPDSDLSHAGLETSPEFLFLIEVPDFVGKGFRLPTVWEWEYACRAGVGTHFCFGDDPTEIFEFGCIRNSEDNFGRKLKFPTACATYKPNAWGLYDVHGNVWEWCMGQFDGSFLKNVQYLKGGSLDSDPFECRCSYIRQESTLEFGMEKVGFGFRVARNR